MGKVYRDKIVPIPKNALVYSGGRVCDPPNGPIREVLIGYAINDSQMHPNSNYFKLHRREWLSYNPDGHYMVCRHVMKGGLYALVLGVAQKYGIYTSLVKIYGIHDANMIMDYVMFLITERENDTYLLQNVLVEEITFTGNPYDDSTYSKFWPRPENENYSRAVLDLWLLKLIADGLKCVYLAFDGSNDDCDAEENDLAEPGEAKSKRNGPIVGFIWAVVADGKHAGLPVTYFMCKGGIIDSKSVITIVEYLKSYGITVKGVLCDRGFCDLDTFIMLLDAKLPYVIMLKKNTKGFKTMVNVNATQIRTLDNFIGYGLYGTTGKAQVFKDSDFTSPISLFFNPATQGYEESNLLNDIINETKEIEDNIRRGVRASVSTKLKRYLSIEGSGKDRVVKRNDEAINNKLRYCGYFAIATCVEMTASEARTAYSYRMIIEKAFSYLKSQLGTDVFRVFTDASAKTKFFVCFIASIIRYDIQATCVSLKLKTNKMIKDMDDFQYLLFNRAYRFVDLAKEPSHKLLNAYGMTEGVLKDFEVEVTRRYIEQDRKRRDYYNALPLLRGKSNPRSENSDTESNASSHESDEHDRTDTPASSDVNDNIIPKKHAGGRPAGSKNKSTLAKEEEAKMRRLLGEPEPEKPKRGRKVGSKDTYPRTRSTKAQMEEKRKSQGA